MINEIVSLPESVILSIKQFINDKDLNSQPLLRDGIFALLEQYCTVLYYPQKDENRCHPEEMEEFLRSGKERLPLPSGLQLGGMLEMGEGNDHRGGAVCWQ